MGTLLFCGGTNDVVIETPYNDYGESIDGKKIATHWQPLPKPPALEKSE
jgi:hypothetical protein